MSTNCETQVVKVEAPVAPGSLLANTDANGTANGGGIVRPWQMECSSRKICTSSSGTSNVEIKTEGDVAIIKREVDQNDDHVPFGSEDDDIEIFTFDRNSLKLKSEMVSRKRSTDRQSNSNSPQMVGASGRNNLGMPERRNQKVSRKLSSGSLSVSTSATSDSSSDSDDDDSSDSNSSDSSSSGSSSDSDSSSSSSSSSSSTSESNSCSSSSSNGIKSKAIEPTSSNSANKHKRRKNVKRDNGLKKVYDVGKVKIERQDESPTMEHENETPHSNGIVQLGTRKSSRLVHHDNSAAKNHENRIKKKLRTLLKKPQNEWTDEDRKLIQNYPKFASEVKKRLRKREVASERLKESEDAPDLLEKKCSQLASLIARSRYLIIYTGAGISTSAKIPDYRGPNGIWTLLQKGEEVTQSLTDFSQTAEPTLTHMAIKSLWERGVCKHVVSQNVDGLHLRSGIPKVALSEVHGNMYVEACVKCGREFVRLFDVTENTRRHHHKTGRCCYHCGTPLKDTIVLFGEKGSLRWPLNWEGAQYNADKADLILCLGSSLKVLRRYPWLWCMSKPAKKRPKLCIVNLQWTPKDQFAVLKINGKCDEVMQRVMSHLRLEIPAYSRETDAIFTIATSLHPVETATKSTEELQFPSLLPYPEKNKDLRNYIRFEPRFKVPIPYEEKTQDRKLFTKSEGNGDNSGSSDLNDCQQTDKPKKRVIKGNNFGWLGNTVANKQQKKRKLK